MIVESLLLAIIGSLLSEIGHSVGKISFFSISVDTGLSRYVNR